MGIDPVIPAILVGYGRSGLPQACPFCAADGIALRHLPPSTIAVTQACELADERGVNPPELHAYVTLDTHGSLVFTCE